MKALVCSSDKFCVIFVQGSNLKGCRKFVLSSFTPGVPTHPSTAKNMEKNKVSSNWFQTELVKP